MFRLIKDYYSDKKLYFKKRIREYFQDFFQFIKDIVFLLSGSYKQVLIFILFCSIFAMITMHFFKYYIYELIMKINNTTYITPYNLKEIIRNPGSFLLFGFLVIISTFISLFEIAGLLHAFSMAQIGRNTDLSSMMAAGGRTCVKALNPRNWLVILFIMVLFPLTRTISISNTPYKLIIPGLVTQIIDYTSLYSKLYRIFYFVLLCVIVMFIFAINIFVLQKSDFIKSCDRSRRLGKGHYLEIFLNFVLLTVLMNFLINSVSSAAVINFRELISMFQKYSGVVSKSAEIGNPTYVLRQILKSIFAPAIYHAGLTALFYRYIEEKDLMRSISADTFKSVAIPEMVRIFAITVIIFIFQVSIIHLISEYIFLIYPVDMPLVCAHRGDNVNAPENTMPAFELAVYENLEWIELDVHQTADNVIVISHDPDIERTTGAKKIIRNSTYEDLRKEKMGNWMPGNYEDVKVPTLKEVLDLAYQNGLNVQVELKGNKNDVNFEENVLKVINETGMHDQVMIIALDYTRLMRIKQLDPDILCGYCMAVALGDLEDIEYSDNISIEENNVTPELVYRMHKNGKKVFCWTVDSEDTVQYLVSCGVDVIGTDNPLLISSALDKVSYKGGLSRALNIMMHTFARMDK